MRIVTPIRMLLQLMWGPSMWRTWMKNILLRWRLLGLGLLMMKCQKILVLVWNPADRKQLPQLLLWIMHLKSRRRPVDLRNGGPC